MSTPFEEIRVDELIPEQLRETASNLINFLKVYYAQEDNNPTALIDFLTKNRDVDQIANEKFLNALGETVAKGIPDSAVVEKAFLLKRLVDYYNLKGTNKSIIIFFQLFYDKLVEVIYPWDYVLETSSARYEENKTLRILPSAGVTTLDIFNLIGKTIEQKNAVGLSIAESKVRRVTVEQYEEQIFTLHLEDNTISGSFSANEKIFSDNVVIGTAYLSLSEIIPLTGGTGFERGDILFVDYQPLSTFQARVSSVGTEGQILKLQIISRGSGNGRGLENFSREDEPGVLPLRIRKANGGNIVEPTNLGGDPEDNLSVRLDFKVVVNNSDVIGQNKNLLSTNIVLQDGVYYDKYTYQINSSIGYESYDKAFNDLIHPAGYNVYANLKLETTPPLEFKERNSYVNVDSLESLVFQPGGSARTYSLYGSSPASSSPDEIVFSSPYHSIVRESYTFSQSPDDVARVLKVIHDPNYSTPKAGYFLEDFVDSGVTLRNLEVSGISGSYSDFRKNGLYKPGVDLSPGFLDYLTKYKKSIGAPGGGLYVPNVTSPGPVFSHGGKIHGLHYWYNTDSTPGFESIIFNSYSAFKTNTIEWRWISRPKEGTSTGYYRAISAEGVGFEIPPASTTSWQNAGTALDNAVIKYGNVTENDKFRTQFR